MALDQKQTEALYSEIARLYKENDFLENEAYLITEEYDVMRSRNYTVYRRYKDLYEDAREKLMSISEDQVKLEDKVIQKL